MKIYFYYHPHNYLVNAEKIDQMSRAFNIFQVNQYFIIYRQYFFLKFEHFS
jgi:hypothetical protein